VQEGRDLGLVGDGRRRDVVSFAATLAPVHLRAVIFDLGGVVLGSPIQAMAAYERDHGLVEGGINRLIAANGHDGAWAAFERGEHTFASFAEAFEAECAAAGIAMSVQEMFAYIRRDGAGPRPAMLGALARLRAAGIRTAALTNNFATEREAVVDGEVGSAASAGDDDDVMGELPQHFDVFVESRRTGLRKPDPRIYELVCDQLGVSPPETAFLDDLGLNLKPAKAMGMHTIKVVDPDEALTELGTLLGLDLRAPNPA
jgi:putative hydrolase of the HAD superfamily